MILRPIVLAAIFGIGVAVAGAAVLSPQRYATVAAQNVALWQAEQKTAVARMSATATRTPAPTRTPTPRP